MENAVITYTNTALAHSCQPDTQTFIRTKDLAVVNNWLFYKLKTYHVSDLASIEKIGNKLFVKGIDGEVIKATISDEKLSSQILNWHRNTIGFGAVSSVTPPPSKPRVYHHSETLLITDGFFAKEDFIVDISEMTGYKVVRPVFLDKINLISGLWVLVSNPHNLNNLISEINTWFPNKPIPTPYMYLFWLILALIPLLSSLTKLFSISLNNERTLEFAIPNRESKKVTSALQRILEYDRFSDAAHSRTGSVPKGYISFEDLQFGKVRLNDTIFKRCDSKHKISEMLNIRLFRCRLNPLTSLFQLALACGVGYIWLVVNVRLLAQDVFSYTPLVVFLILSFVYFLLEYYEVRVNSIEILFKNGAIVSLATNFQADLSTPKARRDYDKRVEKIVEVLKRLVKEQNAGRE